MTVLRTSINQLRKNGVFLPGIGSPSQWFRNRLLRTLELVLQKERGLFYACWRALQLPSCLPLPNRSGAGPTAPDKVRAGPLH